MCVLCAAYSVFLYEKYRYILSIHTYLNHSRTFVTKSKSRVCVEWTYKRYNVTNITSVIDGTSHMSVFSVVLIIMVFYHNGGVMCALLSIYGYIALAEVINVQDLFFHTKVILYVLY